MAIFIRKSEKSKLFSANLFLKSGTLVMAIKGTESRFTEFEIEKAPARGAFSAESILAPQGMALR